LKNSSESDGVSIRAVNFSARLAFHLVARPGRASQGIFHGPDTYPGREAAPHEKPEQPIPELILSIERSQSLSRRPESGFCLARLTVTLGQRGLGDFSGYTDSPELRRHRPAAHRPRLESPADPASRGGIIVDVADSLESIQKSVDILARIPFGLKFFAELGAGVRPEGDDPEGGDFHPFERGKGVVSVPTIPPVFSFTAIHRRLIK
jgi:hypothetical protein